MCLCQLSFKYTTSQNFDKPTESLLMANMLTAEVTVLRPLNSSTNLKGQQKM